MIKQIVFSLCAGIIFTLFVAQHDEWVQCKIAQTFKKLFEQTFDCSISFVVKKVNFFCPELVLTSVVVCPHDGCSWEWHCNRYVTTFTWGHLLRYGSIDMHVILDTINISSMIDNGALAIAPHIAELIKTPTLPVPTFLKSLTLKAATLHVTDADAKIDGNVAWHSSSVKMGTKFKSHLYLIGGKLAIHDKTVATAVTGNLTIDVTNSPSGQKMSVHVDSSFSFPYLGEYDTCYLTGVWKENSGRFSVRSAHDLCAIDPIIVTKRDREIYLQLMARLPFTTVGRFLHNDVTNDHLSGNSFLSMRVTFGELTQVDGQLLFEDICYKKKLLSDLSKLSFIKRNNRWNGNITFRSHETELAGSWSWIEQEKVGKFVLNNINSVQIPHTKWWRILPHDFSCQVAIDPAGVITSSYHGVATNILHNTTSETSGALSVRDDVVTVTGAVNKQRYTLEGLLQPTLRLKKCFYYDEKGIPIISLLGQSAHDTSFDGTIAFPFIRFLIDKCIGYDMQGEGIAHVQGMINGDRITMNCHFADTTIRLPQTYNFINGFDASMMYDIKKRALTVYDMCCVLHTGVIRSPHSILLFDSSGHCTFIHLPLLFDCCLLNVKKDLFASLSGNLLFTHTAMNQPTIKGHIIIDRAQLKENLFADSFQKQLFSYTGTMFAQPNTPIMCDLSIETKSPIRVDTAFLKTDAKVQLRVQNRINNPEVTGSINLLSGSLALPYKSLDIIKGSIYFLPNQLYDPLVELVAKSKIKSYDVTLQVTGSLRAHHILLDASPPLTNEQVIALLLVGSEQESLDIMMPAALIMHNLQQVIFSTNQSLLLQKYFKPILEPFTISLVPNFSDQSGRGGLRGSLEIGVNDRIRALIQKNFSLTEDTRFELEYLLSDDITFRVIRDERRDIGGEVELRWKF